MTEEQEEPQPRPELMRPSTTSDSWSLIWLPESPWTVEGEAGMCLPETAELDSFSFDVSVGGSPFGELSFDSLDLERLVGGSLGIGYWHLDLQLQMYRGNAEDTPFVIHNPWEPTRPGTGSLSWDVEILDLGVAVPVARAAYGQILDFQLAAGLGYYKMTADPSGGTFEFAMPPPGKPEPGQVATEEQEFSGFYGSAALSVRIRLAEHLSAGVTVREVLRRGDAEALQTQIAFALSWAF